MLARLNFLIIVLDLTAQCITEVMFQPVGIQFANTGEVVQLHDCLENTILQISFPYAIQIGIFGKTGRTMNAGIQ